MIFEKENCTVVDTAEESANSKWNTVCSGYYDDKYIGYMTGVRSETLPHQKIGHYLRHSLIHDATKNFYSMYGSESQVVVVGCGYDTLFWICRDENILFKKWFELDKEELINKKAKIISDNAILYSATNQNDGFCLHKIDFNFSHSILNELKQKNFDIHLPTLFIDEFSMIYFDPEKTQNILKEIGNLKNSYLISYGMTLMDDEYGTFIKEGFEYINVPLKSYQLTATEDDYYKLLLNAGFEKAAVMNCNSMLKFFIDENDRKRIVRLEHFDNPREMLHYMRHYCAALGGNQEFVSVLPEVPK